MFEKNTIFGGFAVRDTDKARAFYGKTLGLDVRDGQQPGILEIYGTGSPTPVLVYPKPDHQPANFTVLNIDVDDIDRAVTDLSNAGIRMEHYDRDPIKTDARGILKDGGQAVAWFKDPSGNILAVIQSDKAKTGGQTADREMASSRR